eukprot:scaffold720_cov18-Tisochrysis_lutea.AAC.1
MSSEKQHHNKHHTCTFKHPQAFSSILRHFQASSGTFKHPQALSSILKQSGIGQDGPGQPQAKDQGGSQALSSTLEQSQAFWNRAGGVGAGPEHSQAICV